MKKLCRKIVLVGMCLAAAFMVSELYSSDSLIYANTNANDSASNARNTIRGHDSRPDLSRMESIDKTSPNVAKVQRWFLSDYNMIEPGDYAAWCGDITIASCDDSLDVVGGYGNNWDTMFGYRFDTDLNSVNSTVTITADLFVDTEPGYDFVHLSIKKNGVAGYTDLNTWDGMGVYAVNENATYLPNELYEGDDVFVAWRVTSDNMYSDGDCLWYGAGACQVDDVTLTVTQPGRPDWVDTDDFQFYFGRWSEDPVSVGRTFEYFSVADPDTTELGAGDWTTEASFDSLAAGESIWVGMANYHDAARQKAWTIELIGPSAHEFSASAAKGFIDGTPLEMSTTNLIVVDGDGPPKKRTFFMKFDPQPDWETVKITRDAGSVGLADVEVVVSPAHCSEAEVAADGNKAAGSLSLMAQSIGRSGDDVSITDYQIFPMQSGVDELGAHTFTASAMSGSWTQSVVNVDPDGAARPDGGVRWTTIGPGILGQEQFDLTLALDDAGENMFQVYAFDSSQAEYYSYMIAVDAVSSVPPMRLFSASAYPNPFNPSVEIAYEMSRAGRVLIEIYDARGQVVRKILNESVGAGPGRVSWDGVDSRGLKAASGVYFYRVSAFENTLVGKITMVK